MTRLRTERLALAPVRPEDAGELHRLFLDPAVARYLLDGRSVSIDWVREEIRTSGERFEASGAGLWTVRSTDGSDILGIVGFRAFFDDGELQLLYAFSPSAWGRGLATEAASAICGHALESLGFGEVVAATDEPNEASVRVMERLGMERIRVEDATPWRTVYYRLVPR